MIVVALLVVVLCASAVIAMLASRLPAESEPALLGYPLRGDGSPDRTAFLPLLGAWDTRARAIDWPRAGTDIGLVLICGLAIWRHGLGLDALRGIVLASFLLLVLRIDWQHHLIFLITILPGTVVALLFALWDSPSALLESVAAMVIAGVTFLLLFLVGIAVFRVRALGMGDIWLAAMIGAMTGFAALSALMLGMFLAAGGAIFLIATRQRGRKDFLPYGAYLCCGAIIIVVLRTTGL